MPKILLCPILANGINFPSKFFFFQQNRSDQIVSMHVSGDKGEFQDKAVVIVERENGMIQTGHSETHGVQGVKDRSMVMNMQMRRSHHHIHSLKVKDLDKTIIGIIIGTITVIIGTIDGRIQEGAKGGIEIIEGKTATHKNMIHMMDSIMMIKT